MQCAALNHPKIAHGTFFPPFFFSHRESVRTAGSEHHGLHIPSMEVGPRRGGVLLPRDLYAHFHKRPLVLYVTLTWPESSLVQLECEFVRDARGRLTLTRVSSFEWREGQLVKGRLSTLQR
jgi:hypothetical protein